MRRLLLILPFWLLLPAPAVAAGPSEYLVVTRAHYFMIQRLDYLANASFGPAVVHEQPGGRYWAVVGEVVSGALTGNMPRQVYVAAVRQICDDAEDLACWRLEKLALDGEIVFDSGEPS